MDKMFESVVNEMRKLVNVQGNEGNWDYDPYMQGMYNGMELMLSLAEGREPVYKDAPNKWLCDVDTTGLEPTTATQ